MNKLIGRSLGALLGLGLCTTPELGAATINVTRAGITPGSTINWTRNNTYVLQDLVVIPDGTTLNIESGTVIKGKNLSGSETKLQLPALVIAQGAKIFAEGTPTAPIIFTAQIDDVNNPNDLGFDDTALWGGVMIMGKATINSPKTNGGEVGGVKFDYFEGFNAGDGVSFKFGGNDDNDSSGVMRYVSIRHAGQGLAPDEEINGLSLAGVGRGTTIEFIEVFSNADDGFEFFGGTVNTRYLISAFADDDAFDTDQGWRGINQFWFALQGNTGKQNFGGEYAGDPVSPNNRTPLSDFTVYNATYIGAGVGSTTGASSPGNTGFDLKQDTAAKHYNSIFTDFGDQALRLNANAVNRFDAGDIDFRNNLWFGFVGNSLNPAVIAAGDAKAQLFFTESSRTNLLVDPLLKGISRTSNGGLDPRPNTGSPALVAANIKPVPAGQGLVKTDYMGAFGPHENWAAGWTALSEYGILAQRGTATINVTRASITPGSTINWTRNNTYVLQDLVVIPDGTTLNIEAGTVIKGKSLSGSETKLQLPALVIAQGAKIFAEGTPTAPIIFTAQVDNVNDPEDLAIDDTALWGGVMIMGKATINSPKANGGEVGGVKFDYFEGFNSTDGVAFKFGGADDNDSSGVMRYVSIRHAGQGLAPDEEINGLSMAGVGRGTTIEFIEVFSNADDGFEFFGGTVNTRYLISAFADDDAFDTDQGWRGVNQFWFALQGNTGKQNFGGEYAGDPVSPNNRTPLSDFTVYNATYIGAGVGSVTGASSPGNTGFDLKQDTAAKHYNSIFTDFGDQALRLQANAVNRFDAGDIDFRNNLWFGFVGNSLDPAVITSGDAKVQLFFTESSRMNLLVDPQLKGISRTIDRGLDPRPNTGSPALNQANLRAVAGSGIVATAHMGAFGTMNWAADWTALSEYGLLTAKGGGNPLPVEVVPNQGPSSSQEPQVEALTAGVEFTAIITVGDTAENSPGWRFVGLADGLGAYDNTNSTFTVLVNHEINETKGIVRAHGAIGTFVSKLIIDKATLQVLNGQDLITNVYTFNTNTFVYELGANVLMGRFCSADLPPVSAFYNSGNGKGTQNRIFMNGEEFSTQSRAWAHIASGPETGNSWQLPLLGRASWENVVASPYMQDKTIVVGLDDDSTVDSQVYIYIGTKQTTGASDVEKAGLMNGQLYGVSVAGLVQEVAGTTEGVRNFSLVNLSALTDVRVATFDELETTGNGAGVSSFMRVEDGAWNPTNPNEFWFVTTAHSSLPSRLWRLTFNDIANPETGGVIEMMLNGTEGQIMFDNLGFANDGTIILQEDPGNNARLARIYKYYPATDGLIAIGQAKQSLFKSGEPGFITQDEEVSGAIDVSDILGEGAFLIVNQIHSGAAVGNDPELVEGGQLLVMYITGTTPSINTQPTPVNVGGGTAATFTVAASAGSSVQWYKNGTPIAGATGTSYSIPAPSTGDAGEYVAVVTTASGSTSSTAVALTVTDLAMYAGVAVAGPIGAQYDVQFTTDLSGTPVWTTLERITISSSPTLYIDQSSPGQAKRFYRALEVGTE